MSRTLSTNLSNFIKSQQKVLSYPAHTQQTNKDNTLHEVVRDNHREYKWMHLHLKNDLL